MGEAVAVQNGQGAAIEAALIQGDLSKMSAEDRAFYYNAVCKSLGLNPLTQPFQYLNLNGKLTLYARKDCTDQLRSIHGVSIRIVNREVVEDVYVVTAQAAKPDGRVDESIGAVSIAGLKGEARSNALMKAEAKAKRRVTLSICGLAMIDESELESIPGAAPIFADPIEGSRQQQAEVLEGKLLAGGKSPEEAKAEADKFIETTEPKKRRGPAGVDMSKYYAAMEEAKNRLGNDLYYAILAKHKDTKGEPIAHANLVPDAIVKALWADIREALLDQKNRELDRQLMVSESDIVGAHSVGGN